MESRTSQPLKRLDGPGSSIEPQAAPGSGGTALTAAGIVEWRRTVRRFFADSLDELYLLREGLKLSEPAGAASQEAVAGARCEPVAATSMSQPPGSTIPCGPAPKPPDSGQDNAQHRLAELARQLDERLQKFKRQGDR